MVTPTGPAWDPTSPTYVTLAKKVATAQQATQAVPVLREQTLTTDISLLQPGKEMGYAQIMGMCGQLNLIADQLAKTLQNNDLQQQINLGNFTQNQLFGISTLANAIDAAGQAGEASILSYPPSDALSDLFTITGFGLVGKLLREQKKAPSAQQKKPEEELLGALAQFFQKTSPPRPEYAKALTSAGVSSGTTALDLLTDPAAIMTLLAQCISSQNFADTLKRQLNMAALLTGISQVGLTPNDYEKILFAGQSRGTLSQKEIELLTALIEQSKQQGLTEALLNSLLSLASNITAIRNMAFETIIKTIDQPEKLSQEQLRALIDLVQSNIQFALLLQAALIALSSGLITPEALFGGKAFDTLVTLLASLGLPQELASLFANQLAPTLATIQSGLQEVGMTPSEALLAQISLLMGRENMPVPEAVRSLLPEDQAPTVQNILGALTDRISAAPMDEPKKQELLRALNQLATPRKAPPETGTLPSWEEMLTQFLTSKPQAENPIDAFIQTVSRLQQALATPPPALMLSAQETEIAKNLFTITPQQEKVRRQEQQDDEQRYEQKVSFIRSLDVKILKKLQDNLAAYNKTQSNKVDVESSFKTLADVFSRKPNNLVVSKMIDFLYSPAKIPAKEWSLTTRTQPEKNKISINV